MSKTTYDEMYAIVVKVLIEDFKKPIEDITPNTNIKDDLGLDSLDRVDFLCAVEAAYGDDVFDEDENADPEVAKRNQQRFYLSKTVGEFTSCLLEAVNEYEEKKGD